MITIQVSFKKLLSSLFSYDIPCERIKIEEDSSGQHWMCLHLNVNNNHNNNVNRNLASSVSSFVQNCCSIETNDAIEQDSMLSVVFKRPSAMLPSKNNNCFCNNDESQNSLMGSQQYSSALLSSQLSVSKNNNSNLFSQRQNNNSTTMMMMTPSFSASASSNRNSSQFSFSQLISTPSSQQHQKNIFSNIINTNFCVVYLALDEWSTTNSDEKDEINRIQNSSNDLFNFYVAESKMKISSTSIDYWNSYFSVISVMVNEQKQHRHNINEFSVESMTFGSISSSSPSSSTVNNNSNNNSSQTSSSSFFSASKSFLLGSTHQEMITNNSDRGTAILCLNPSCNIFPFPKLSIHEYANFIFYNPNHDPSSNNNILNYHRLQYFIPLLPKMFKWFLEVVRKDAQIFVSNNKESGGDDNIRLLNSFASNPLPPILRDANRFMIVLNFIQKVLHLLIERMKRMDNTSKKTKTSDSTENETQISSRRQRNDDLDGKQQQLFQNQSFFPVLRPSDITQLFLSLLILCWENPNNNNNNNNTSNTSELHLQVSNLLQVQQNIETNSANNDNSMQVAESFLTSFHFSQAVQTKIASLSNSCLSSRNDVGFISVIFASVNNNHESNDSIAWSLISDKIRWQVTPCPFVKAIDYKVRRFEEDARLFGSKFGGKKSKSDNKIEYRFPVIGLNGVISTASSSTSIEIKSMTLIFENINDLVSSSNVETGLRRIAMKSPFMFLPSSNSNEHNNNPLRDAITKRLMVQTFAPAMIQSICNIIERSGSLKFKEEICKILDLVVDDDDDDVEDEGAHEMNVKIHDRTPQVLPEKNYCSNNSTAICENNNRYFCESSSQHQEEHSNSTLFGDDDDDDDVCNDHNSLDGDTDSNSLFQQRTTPFSPNPSMENNNIDDDDDDELTRLEKPQTLVKKITRCKRNKNKKRFHVLPSSEVIFQTVEKLLLS